MNKLIKGLAIKGLVLATFGTTSTITTASAKADTMPKSYRGTWYGNHQTWKIGKHSLKVTRSNGKTWGVPSKHFATSKVKHGWRVVGVNHTDDVTYIKRTTQSVHGHNRVVLDNFILKIPDSAPYSVQGFTRYHSMKNYSIKNSFSYIPW